MNYSLEEKKNGRKAFKKLERKKCPVKKTNQGDGYTQYGGIFCIDAEEESAETWLNYYPVSMTEWEHGTLSDKLMKILEHHNLYAEWANPAVAVIYPI